MEVDFCPVLCIPEVPVLQAFRGISHFGWTGHHWRTPSGSGQGSQRKRKSNPEAVRRKRTIVR